MSALTIVLIVASVMLSVTVFLQWIYIRSLEQKIQGVESELHWGCKACERAEYIYNALE